MHPLASLIGVLIFIGIFLLCREVMCWYWKVNEAIEILKEIRDNIKR